MNIIYVYCVYMELIGMFAQRIRCIGRCVEQRGFYVLNGWAAIRVVFWCVYVDKVLNERWFRSRWNENAIQKQYVIFMLIQ